MRVPWEKLEEAFEQCHALSGEPRRAYLNDLAKQDTELFIELRKLLEADDLAAADSFFEPGALQAASLLKDHFVGKQIGTFTITDMIGEGGMGAVYRAEQTRPFHRLAAIKVIWASHTNEHLLRRFDVEVQTLARLNHPNIASVYFSGVTDNGLPYFCMELIDGLPLDVYCRENSLGVADRLTIFAEICRAVHFAHQRGVIHRDIKPANILIAEVDGRPQVKMIDFGIAKAVQDDKQIEHSFQVTATLLTIPGMAVGTLGYMSPEQTLVSDQDVDLRTDVYALGVVLYELLVGDLPISRQTISEKSWDQIFKAIRDKTPTIPSQAVLSVAEDPHGENGLDKAALSKKYRGDIDWMVMKALAKEPDRRYESAAAFAEDCERHLANEPVLARPPSLGYQISRFVKRNKGLSAGLFVVLAALITGIVGLGAGYYQARQAEQRMQEEVNTANVTIDVLDEFLISVAPYREGSEVKMIDQLNNFSPKIESFNVDTKTRARLYNLVGKAYVSIGEHESARVNFEKSRPLMIESYGENSNEAFEISCRIALNIFALEGWVLGGEVIESQINKNKVNKDTSKWLFRLNLHQASFYITSLRFEKAKEFLIESERILMAFHKDDIDLRIDLYNKWGWFYMFQCRSEQALGYYERVFEVDDGRLYKKGKILSAYIDFSHVLNEIGDYERADMYIKKAMTAYPEYYGQNSYKAFYPYSANCHNLVERGSYERALTEVCEIYNAYLDVQDDVYDVNFDFLIELTENASSLSGNEDAFMGFIENHISRNFGLSKDGYSIMTQRGVFGAALLNYGEILSALPLLLSAYEKANELGHFRSFNSAIYSYRLSQIYSQIGQYEQAADWGCVSISHYEQLYCSTYTPPFIELKSQWVRSLVLSDYPEGVNELDKVIQDAIRGYGENHKNALKLMAFKESMKERLKEKASL